MTKVLGLDIGTNSIGFALIDVNEENKLHSILKLGSRIVVEDPDFHGNFKGGRTASKNADRRTKRGIRRLNQRYKLRRDKLLEILKQHGMMPSDGLLHGLSATELYGLRVKALTDSVSLQELGRIFYHLNQRRGFKSNRKASNPEASETAFMEKLRTLTEAVEHKTIGQYFSELLESNPVEKIRENVFPRKAYEQEFDKIWMAQQGFHPDILTGGPNDPKNLNTLYNQIKRRTIFFQRKLKSQKGLVNHCTFEKNMKVAPKSSPIFQVFRIWQQVNNLTIRSDQGEIFFPTQEDRTLIFRMLNDPARLNKQGKCLAGKILKEIKYPAGFYLNYPHLEGNKTIVTLYQALVKAGIPNPMQYLYFDPHKGFEQGGLFMLWHITYSIEEFEDVVNALVKHFSFNPEQAAIIADSAGYTSDYGSLSAKAIRKLLPYLEEGQQYDKACELAGYRHWQPDDIQRTNHIELLNPNTLRNPVVEQVLNQLANVVNNLIESYGRPDEIRVELARELKSNAKQRKNMTDGISKNRKRNEEITRRLLEHDAFRSTRVTMQDIVRYKLWEETDRICLYSGRLIQLSELYSGETEIEHIIPRSRLFDDSLNNKIISFRAENKLKDQMTAHDYMRQKEDAEYAAYVETVNRLYKEDKINKAKHDRLLWKGEDIPEDFVSRQLKETQYIAREAVVMLRRVCDKVVSTTGSITSMLRKDWELEEVMQELNFSKYVDADASKIKQIEVKDSQGNMKPKTVIDGWSKRDDHRHHAVDALVVALTTQGIIQKINRLNATYMGDRENGVKALRFPIPHARLRDLAKQALEEVLVSFKKPRSKVLTPKKNITENGHVQQTWVPRGSLHEDTMMGSVYRYEKQNLRQALLQPGQIAAPEWRQLMQQMLEQNQGDVKAALGALKKWAKHEDQELPECVTVMKQVYAKRVNLNEQITLAQVEKILDSRIRRLVKDRIAEAGGIKQAFRDYDKNPIYQNREKGIIIRSVKVRDEGKLQAVRSFQIEGQEARAKDFVYLKGNHHALIYQDELGNYVEKVVSFWEAVERCLNNLRENGSIYPVIDKTDKPGLKFMFSLQINDMFLIDVNTEEVDVLNPANRPLLSKSLFRLQKLSEGYYVFRHHLETSIQSEAAFAFQRMQSMGQLKRLTKVHLNNLGLLIRVGE